MKIKVSEKERKAIIRFKHPMELDWFKRTMASIRDSDQRTHPPIVLKDENGNVKFPPPPPPMQVPNSGEHIVVDKNIYPQGIPPQNLKMNPIVVKKDDVKKQGDRI
ncbi:hypothetical protein KKH23_09120 [Patescibacteria group bacterium]|nr:hypothetical protein [Patescibacteria group bacterium]